MIDAQDQSFLTKLFDTAITAADPRAALAPFLPERPKGRTVVIGAGKGSAHLAAAFEQLWEDPVQGVVVTRCGFAVPCQNIQVLEAAHPVPDAAGFAASRVLFDTVNGLTADDLVIALISGGGSALLPMPPNGLTLQDEIDLNTALLASGAPISVMNMIRKQLSDIKGGRLAVAAAPACVVSLIVSDVPGDDPAQVASGPTVPNATTRQDAMTAIAAYKIELPPAVLQFLEISPETALLPNNPVFAKNEVHVIASAAQSLEAAAKYCETLGVSAVILSDAIEGEAREIAKVHAAIAREVRRKNRPFQAPVVVLSGGETTVTLKAGGKGGRNTEFLLSLALELEGVERVTALAADTDGIDGSEDNAGAFVDGTTAGRLRMAGHDPAVFLANNDAWSAFAALGDLFVPGPTGTNVNDFRAILIR